MRKQIVYRIEDDMDREEILCTTYQMRNFYKQFRDGFFSNLDVMNYIQHFKAAEMCKKGMNILDVCCGRSLILPLLRYYAKDINSYTGIDICESNIREAMKGASKTAGTKGGLKKEELAGYYPFDVRWICGNVAEMTKKIQVDSMDFVIYTSSIEHMNPDDGLQSLIECYKVMKPGAKMFLSCPNTPGNGYDTQYRAHIYEWGYKELKEALDNIGFTIENEIGLVIKGREMDNVISKQSAEIQAFYKKMKDYMPTVFLSAFMAIPFPEQADELLFIVRKD